MRDLGWFLDNVKTVEGQQLDAMHAITAIFEKITLLLVSASFQNESRLLIFNIVRPSRHVQQLSSLPKLGHTCIFPGWMRLPLQQEQYPGSSSSDTVRSLRESLGDSVIYSQHWKTVFREAMLI